MCIIDPIVNIHNIATITDLQLYLVIYPLSGYIYESVLPPTRSLDGILTVDV